MQDCLTPFAEDENTDLFAQSPERQRAPFADAVDGPSAEDALFGRFQQGESACLEVHAVVDPLLWRVSQASLKDQILHVPEDALTCRAW